MQEGETLCFIPVPDASFTKSGLSIGTMESLEIPFLTLAMLLEILINVT